MRPTVGFGFYRTLESAVVFEDALWLPPSFDHAAELVWTHDTDEESADSENSDDSSDIGQSTC